MEIDVVVETYKIKWLSYNRADRQPVRAVDIFNFVSEFRKIFAVSCTVMIITLLFRRSTKLKKKSSSFHSVVRKGFLSLIKLNWDYLKTQI